MENLQFLSRWMGPAVAQVAMPVLRPYAKLELLLHEQPARKSLRVNAGNTNAQIDSAPASPVMEPRVNGVAVALNYRLPTALAVDRHPS